MQTQKDIFPVRKQDLPRLIEVWEASVRATHLFLSESDIQFFQPLVCDELSGANGLVCVRDASGQVVGFIGERKISGEMRDKTR
jgi:putative acetyltransferase